MAKAEIHSGRCGFITTVEAVMKDDEHVSVTISSQCKNCQKLGTVLTEVDPMREISFRGEGPLVLELAPQYLAHPGCPVPAGIIKAVEVAAGLALPADAKISLV